VQFRAGDEGKFVFFLRYAKDVIDRYGRLLAYLTVNVENPADIPALSYNEFMLESGLAAPYFIWPNLDPFKKQPTAGRRSGADRHCRDRRFGPAEKGQGLRRLRHAPTA